MNNWIGKWLITVAILHMLLAFIFLGEPLRQLLSNGAVDSVNSSTWGTAAIYLLFSLLLLFVAFVVDSRHSNDKTLPMIVAVSFLLILTGCILMAPASAFWLALPPAVYLVLAKRKSVVSN